MPCFLKKIKKQAGSGTELYITIIYFGEVLIYPNTSALAMNMVTDTAHAAAVMGFLTIGLPTLAVLSLSLFSINTLLLPMIFAGLCAAIIVVFRLMSVRCS